MAQMWNLVSTCCIYRTCFKLDRVTRCVFTCVSYLDLIVMATDQWDSGTEQDHTGSAVFTLCQMFYLLTDDTPVLSGPASICTNTGLCVCVLVLVLLHSGDKVFLSTE